MPSTLGTAGAGSLTTGAGATGRGVGGRGVTWRAVLTAAAGAGAARGLASGTIVMTIDLGAPDGGGTVTCDSSAKITASSRWTARTSRKIAARPRKRSRRPSDAGEKNAGTIAAAPRPRRRQPQPRTRRDRATRPGASPRAGQAIMTSEGCMLAPGSGKFWNTASLTWNAVDATSVKVSICVPL